CAIVKNLKFDDEKIKSIIQIQEKLHISYGRHRKKLAIGIYPLEKIKFPVTYKALPPEKIKFIPLEYNTVLNGRQILSKTPTGREYAHLLENEKVYPFFIDANNGILSMPPIINSNDTGKISLNTKEVFIECSGFDFNVLKKCLNMIVTALADIGGTIYSLTLDYNGKKEITPNLTPEKIKLNLNYTNKILGLDLKESEVKELLERMGYNYKAGLVEIPCYRADILHEIDIIEDIAKAYGYENFKEEIPNVSTIASESYFVTFKRKISEILIGLGLLECSSFHLSNETSLNKKMNLKNPLVEVEKPVNLDYNILRNNLLPNLLEILQKNKQYEYPQNIFELGIVFKKDEKKIVKEIESLAIVKSQGNFTEIKQILDVLLSSLSLEYEILEVSNSSYIEGRVGNILVNNKKIGTLGEINPEVLNNFEIEMPSSALEINLTELFKLTKH
ncbi:MAG: phenylalanine--tRNA ligase subunit beta, partial [Nanoarchaeota archaeon]|nr:phenylalanine--tRNA ligase subunit beta [Nanoarchaeota archaeon]